MTLYTLRYRDKFQVHQGLIEASSFEKAEELGRGWCIREQVKYLKMEEAILAREKEEGKEGVLVGTMAEQAKKWAGSGKQVG